MGIAENIKRRRLELKISQQELADAMGYKSRSTIAKIESGENTVPEAKIAKFAQVLYTTPHFLKTGTQESVPIRFFQKPDQNGLHKNIVIVLAGGKSTRNMQNIPNQFISVLGKPVVIYCLEAYQRHPAIDDIYVVCMKGWESILSAYAKQYGIEKLRGVIPAGDTGILSVKNGFDFIRDKYAGDDVIIFQESTRPLVTEEMISKLLKTCAENGSAITGEPMDDCLQFELESEEIEKSRHSKYLDRNRVVMVQSPEAYRLSAIKEAFQIAEEQHHIYDETCPAMFMHHLNFELHFYEGNHNNIKIVRQEDIAVLTALLKTRL